MSTVIPFEPVTRRAVPAKAASTENPEKSMKDNPRSLASISDGTLVSFSVTAGVGLAASVWAVIWLAAPPGKTDWLDMLGRFLTFSAILGLLCAVAIFLLAHACRSAARLMRDFRGLSR